MCTKYGKTKHQARFTFLFNMFNRNILNRKEKELVWRTLMETQYLKGTLFGNNKKFAEEKEGVANE